MAVNLQTIKDYRNYLIKELSYLYGEREATSVADLVISDIMCLTSIPDLLSILGRTVTRENAEKIMELCSILKTGKPVQYVLGETTFYNCRIKVREGVLIPRNETEELVDVVIRENPSFSGCIMDIGTGTGCIAIALALNLPEARVIGIDSSDHAIRTASENALLNKADISILKADILSHKRCDIPEAEIIVSNPPYVRLSEKGGMHCNVVDFEPHEALFVPDTDPLVFYRAILEIAVETTEKTRKVYFEINEALGKEMRDLAHSFGYSSVRILKDINGKDRILIAE